MSSRNNHRKGGRRGGFGRGRGGSNQGRCTFEKSGYRHQNQLTEEEVGMTEYISELEGYSAVIKARFSDFQVNEIDIEGRIAKLTNTSIPKNFETLLEKPSYETTLESPLEKLSQDTWDALKKLVSVNVDAGDEVVELEAGNFTKDERKEVHECVKRYFGRDIVASTVTKDEKTVLQFKKMAKGSKDNRTPWPQNTPEFVHFIVYKELMDTMDSCYKIADALRMPPHKVTYAGVKDRRAKTSQWFCLKKYEPSKIIAKTKHIRNLKIGNFEFKEKCLKIGQLKGNQFRIALRNVQADDDAINASLKQTKDHGFINYYGLQRFGNDKETPTFLIGIKLLKGEWKEAVNLILKVKTSDDPHNSINKAKKEYAETGDAQKALSLCGKWQNGVEKKLLEGLAKNHANNYVDALESIPRPMRLMYIHAYQSLIWNKMASKRIKEFGLKPVEGDLILIDDSQEDLRVTEDAEDEETEDAEREKVDVCTDNGENKARICPVRPLKADELDKYTIFDIVLPLPGYDIVYPENLKQFYKEAIEECGLTLEMPQQKVRTYSLSGAYRKIVQRASNFEWKIMLFNDPTDNLIRSDLEELNGEEEPKSIEGGKYKAVVIIFTLSPASYATMVLREVLKCNTSSSSQATLNDYGEKKTKIILESTNGVHDSEGASRIDEVQQGSLLSDKAKYEEFKNNLFKDILGDASSESTTKRELEGDEDVPGSKKIKTDAE